MLENVLIQQKLRESYVDDCFGVVPETRQVLGFIQTAEHPRETLQDRCSSPESQTTTLHLVKLVALSQHFKSVLDRKGRRKVGEKMKRGSALATCSFISISWVQSTVTKRRREQERAEERLGPSFTCHVVTHAGNESTDFLCASHVSLSLYIGSGRIFPSG